MNNYADVLKKILEFRKKTELKPFIITKVNNNGLRGYGWSFRTTEFIEFFLAWYQAPDYSVFKEEQLLKFKGSPWEETVNYLFELYEIKALHPEIACQNVNGYDCYGIIFYDMTLYLVFCSEIAILKAGLSDATLDIIDADFVTTRSSIVFPEEPAKTDNESSAPSKDGVLPCIASPEWGGC